MSKKPKVVRSMMYWVEPPENGQSLEELEWVWTDIYDDGRMVIRDQRPTDDEVANIIKELEPMFNWDQEMIQAKLD